MITHDTPTSTNIARLNYDDQAGELTVEFRNGRKYKYKEVSYDTWNSFISAQSAGKFFNERIRDAYKGTEI